MVPGPSLDKVGFGVGKIEAVYGLILDTRGVDITVGVVLTI